MESNHIFTITELIVRIGNKLSTVFVLNGDWANKCLFTVVNTDQDLIRSFGKCGSIRAIYISIRNGTSKLIKKLIVFLTSTKLIEFNQVNVVNRLHSSRVVDFFANVIWQRNTSVIGGSSTASIGCSIHWLISECTNVLHYFRRDKQICQTLRVTSRRSSAIPRAVNSTQTSHQSIHI